MRCKHRTITSISLIPAARYEHGFLYSLLTVRLRIDRSSTLPYLLFRVFLLLFPSLIYLSIICTRLRLALFELFVSVLDEDTLF